MAAPASRSSESNRPEQSYSLSTLAAVAAIALERRANGFTDATLDSAHRLADVLRQKLPSGETTATRSELFNPSTADLLSRALHEAHSGDRVAPSANTVEELRVQAASVIEQLGSVTDRATNEVISQLRDFCLALAKGAQSQYATSRAQPSNRYRK